MSYPFAVDIQEKIFDKQNDIFDYCYAVSEQRWVTWQYVNIQENGVISSSFENDYLDIREILRLNPYALEYMFTKQNLS